MPLWALAVLVLVVSAATVLIWQLWRRSSETGRTPERSFALFATVVVAGHVGWIASASLAARLGWQIRFVLSAASEGLIALGFAALCVGTWRFFRPASRAAGGAALLAVACLAGAWAALVAEGRPIEPGAARLAPALLSGARTAALAWWGAECLRYFGLMRRRLAHGLAEAEQTARFGYLGLGSLLVAAALALVPLCGWWLSRLPREVPAVLAAIVGLAAIGVPGIVLGLLPGSWLSRLPRFARLAR